MHLVTGAMQVLFQLWLYTISGFQRAPNSLFFFFFLNLFVYNYTTAQFLCIFSQHNYHSKHPDVHIYYLHCFIKSFLKCSVEFMCEFDMKCIVSLRKLSKMSRTYWQMENKKYASTLNTNCKLTCKSIFEYSELH